MYARSLLLHSQVLQTYLDNPTTQPGLPDYLDNPTTQPGLTDYLDNPTTQPSLNEPDAPVPFACFKFLFVSPALSASFSRSFIGLASKAAAKPKAKKTPKKK
jgi:hypothetical protein